MDKKTGKFADLSRFDLFLSFKDDNSGKMEKVRDAFLLKEENAVILVDSMGIPLARLRFK